MKDLDWARSCLRNKWNRLPKPNSQSLWSPKSSKWWRRRKEWVRTRTRCDIGACLKRAQPDHLRRDPQSNRLLKLNNKSLTLMLLSLCSTPHLNWAQGITAKTTTIILSLLRLPNSHRCRSYSHWMQTNQRRPLPLRSRPQDELLAENSANR